MANPGDELHQDKAENEADKESEASKEEQLDSSDSTSDTPKDESGTDTEAQLGDQEGSTENGQTPRSSGKIKRFFSFYWHKKAWTIPLTVVVLVMIIFAIPGPRYKLLGLVVTRSFTVSVEDNRTDTAVSGARVTLDGKTAVTDSAGRASFKVRVGDANLQVSKKYYEVFSEAIFVGIKSSTNTREVRLVATGRQVPIRVINKISGKPIANAEINVLDTEAKTNADGKATIVLPTGLSERSATILANGYNNLSSKIQITGKMVSANIFSLTPMGKVYFLSNLSGTIDVVSSNLDGSDYQTVLAGTGTEDPNNTVLLASQDWKYLALLSKRDGGQNAKLFLINTNNEQLTTVDGSNATFTPIGWSGHHFVYEKQSSNVQLWQPGQYEIDSYNADTGTTTILDQTTATGASDLDYVGQSFGSNDGSGGDIDIIGSQVVYVKEWATGPDVPSGTLNNKQLQIMSVNVTGGSQQVVRSIPEPVNSIGYLTVTSLVYAPGVIYYQVMGSSGNVYYEYNNNTVTQTNTISDDSFDQDEENATTYLLSPSGTETFWAEQRDGQNSLFVGDTMGNNGKQIASLSSFTTYGWYTDNYVLVEKGGNQLYIMPSIGGTALKISAYYKPPEEFNGYGGL